MNIKDRLKMAKSIINNKKVDEFIKCIDCPLGYDYTETNGSECTTGYKQGVKLKCRDEVVAFYFKNIDKVNATDNAEESTVNESTPTTNIEQEINEETVLKLSDAVSMPDVVRIDSVESELSTPIINVFEQCNHLGKFYCNAELVAGTLLMIDNKYYKIVSYNTVAQVCFVVKSNYGCNYGDSIDGFNEITCPLCLHEICGSDTIPEGERIICSDCGAGLEFQRTVKYDTIVTESPKIICLE